MYILTAISTASTNRKDSVGNSLTVAYGVSADYVPNSTNFETLMVNFLYANVAYVINLLAQNITLNPQGYIQSQNYAEDSNFDPIAGFRLDAAANVIKSFGSTFTNAKIKNAIITGNINGVAPDQLVPQFTHRVKYSTAGTYNWTVPANVRFVRITMCGGGGGGGGGTLVYGGNTYYGGTGGTGGSSSFGGYLTIYGGTGGSVSAGGSSPTPGSNKDSTDVILSGRSGGSGGACSYSVGGPGGVFGLPTGPYIDAIEKLNIAGTTPIFSIPSAATTFGSTAGTNGQFGCGGSGGSGEPGSGSVMRGGYGGGTSVVRQLIVALNESQGQTVTITIGAGGSAGAAGTNGSTYAYAGGKGGDGQLVIEY